MAMEALSSAAVADACVRLKIPPRGIGLRPIMGGLRIQGRVLPVQHAGSVDVIFEAIQQARKGDVLVVDNQARSDEACVGDLTALEAVHHSISAILIDGLHRDTAALRTIGLPVWSRGTTSFGPLSARPRPSDALRVARVGGFEASREDSVVADDDGAVFFPERLSPVVLALARKIQDVEGDQARRARAGEPLCEQFQVAAFLSARAKDPNLTFRAHLRKIGKAIEE